MTNEQFEKLMDAEMKKNINELAYEECKDQCYSTNTAMMFFKSGAESAVKLISERKCENCFYKHPRIDLCERVNFLLKDAINPQTFYCSEWKKKE